VQVRFPALQHFLSSNGSGTGTIQPVSTIEKLLGRESRGSGLKPRIREYGRRDPSL
jgi:hypothetical protein